VVEYNGVVSPLGEVSMIRAISGTIHGKRIELDEDLGVAEGQKVEVQVKIVSPDRQWGDGLRRCAGALAKEWTQEDDRILVEIHQERKQDIRKEVVE
jgi:hypothetical protein